MTSLFRSLEADDLTEDERPIFDVLKASLYYPSTPDVLAQRLSDDIVFFCKSAREGEDPGAILSIVLTVVFDMIACIPADHEWQDAWAKAITCLRGQEPLPPRGDIMPQELSWQDMTLFQQEQRELTDRHKGAKDVSQWRNVTSFNARLYASGVTNTHYFPLWDLRDTVEMHDSAATVPRDDMWVATEWVVRCADRIFEFMRHTDEPVEEKEERACKFGKKFAAMEGVGLLSVQRWNLWKQWFEREKSRLEGDHTADLAVLTRILEVVKKMHEAEEEGERQDSLLRSTEHDLIENTRNE